MKNIVLLILMLPIVAFSQCDTVYIEVETPVIYGCMWPASCNYNDEATVDDGSCLTCDTPYEVGALLCDYYHGINGIWDWWISIKCGIYEPPVETCDTVYVELPSDTIYTKLPADTIEVFIIDTLEVFITDTLQIVDTLHVTEYVKLPPDTVLLTTTELVDCFTGELCDDCDYSLYVPNSFTPNADGDNDLFCPQGSIECWPDLEFRIYDRWGQLVYIGDMLNGDCWDGIGHAIGIYVWTITSEDIRVTSGHVTLIR